MECKLTDYKITAQERLAEQFKDKPNLKAFIEEISPSAIVFWEAKYPKGIMTPKN